MTILFAIWSWVVTHPIVVLSVIVWVIASVAPRPHPAASTGWKKLFWLVLDRVCFLTAGKVPGALKMVLYPSPVPATPDPVVTVDPE